MSLLVESPGAGQPVTIAITGRFDFHVNEEFRRAYASQPVGTAFIVDLSRAEYLDSSALGMLLLLRRHAGDKPEGVRLMGPSADVRRILEIAKFDRLCRIG
jgi:anti-anti-sigma factor